MRITVAKVKVLGIVTAALLFMGAVTKLDLGSQVQGILSNSNLPANLTPTTVNKLTITTPTTGATLTLANGSTLSLNGAFNTQFTGSANATFILPPAGDTLGGLAAIQTLVNKTLTTPIINGATGTAPTWTGTEQVPSIKANSFGGYTTATLATGSAAGTSPTLACAASHVCTATNGTLTLTVGSSPAAGTLLTITSPTARTNLPDCDLAINLTASPYTSAGTNYRFTYTTTVTTIALGTALTAANAYTISYACLGY